MNVRYRESAGGGKTFWIFTLALVVVVGGGTAAALYFAKPWPNWYIAPAITGVTIFLMLLLFSRSAIEVRDDGIRASMGPIFRKTFAREEIERVAVEKYNWKEFGGWGYKMSLRGASTYSAIGVSGCVRIFLKSGKTFVVTLNNPQAAKDAYDGTTR